MFNFNLLCKNRMFEPHEGGRHLVFSKQIVQPVRKGASIKMW